MKQTDKFFADEKLDPREEMSRLSALFAHIGRVVTSLPGVDFYHLEPGEVGTLKDSRLQWNAWLHVRSEDRVFPFLLAIEPGRHSNFRMRIHPDIEVPTDATIVTALRQIMSNQMTGVDAMFIRQRYWNDNREEPVRSGILRAS